MGKTLLQNTICYILYSLHYSNFHALKTVEKYEDTVLLKKSNKEWNGKIQKQLFIGFAFDDAEPLYFVKVTEKGTAHEDLTDSYDHFITSGENFLKGFHWKTSSSKQISKKSF